MTEKRFFKGIKEGVGAVLLLLNMCFVAVVSNAAVENQHSRHAAHEHGGGHERASRRFVILPGAGGVMDLGRSGSARAATPVDGLHRRPR